MITLDISLPPGALLPPEAETPKAPINPVDTGALWFAACAPGLTEAAWRCFPMDGPAATPADPHEGGLDQADTGGLRFTGGVNTGWVLPDLTEDLQQITLALRVNSSGEARSLFTLNPRNGDTYLFLNEKNGQLSLQEDDKRMEPLTQATSPGKRWILASYAQGALTLAQGLPDAPLTPSRRYADLTERLTGPVDLFIGCRSHRRGILKTLGDFTLHDLLIWPDQDALTDADTLAGLRAACRFIEAERP